MASLTHLETTVDSISGPSWWGSTYSPSIVTNQPVANEYYWPDYSQPYKRRERWTEPTQGMSYADIIKILEELKPPKPVDTTPKVLSPTEIGKVEGDQKDVFSTLSGCDTRVRIDGVTLGGTQTIDLTYTPGKHYKGTILVMLLGKETVDQLVDRLQGTQIEIIGANEYGHSGSLITAGELQIKTASVKLSVDDLTWETTLHVTIYPVIK